MLPVVAIIGRPNVGKSTLFNRITGSKQAVTADLAGTTRDRLYAKTSWNDREFIVVDTAGIEVGNSTDSVYQLLDEDVQEQVKLAIDEADSIVFVVDVTTGATEQDTAAIRLVQKSGKSHLVVANKYDSEKYLANISELYRLGSDQILPVSALTGRNTGDLLDKISETLSSVTPTSKEIPIADEGIRVAIAGRPNVGKSSLFNALLGKKMAVVSRVAGTTRDFNISTLEAGGLRLNFIDTAGIRRRGKVGKAESNTTQNRRTLGQIEKYSVLRSFRAIESADVVMLLIDPTEGLTAQDLHIAGFARDQFKSIIIVVNKWDAVDEDEKNMQEYLGYLHSKISFLPFAPVVFVSATTGKNVHKIADVIFEVAAEREKRIATAELNLLIGYDILRKSPPAVRGQLPKINYITQAETNPPTFIFFANKPELIHFSYKRYLENRIRDRWGYTGTPIRIVFKKKNEDYNKAAKGKKRPRR